MNFAKNERMHAWTAAGGGCSGSCAGLTGCGAASESSSSSAAQSEPASVSAAASDAQGSRRSMLHLRFAMQMAPARSLP